MTRPPCVRLCPAYPGNPRMRIEGESPPLCKGTYGLRSVAKRCVSKDEARNRHLGPHGSRRRQRASSPRGATDAVGLLQGVEESLGHLQVDEVLVEIEDRAGQVSHLRVRQRRTGPGVAQKFAHVDQCPVELDVVEAGGPGTFAGDFTDLLLPFFIE